MNKKYIILLCVSFLFLSLVVAQVIVDRNTEVTYDKKVRDKLYEHGIINPKTTALNCDIEYCNFKMYQEKNTGDYNLGEHTIPRRQCTDYGELTIENAQKQECFTWVNYTTVELESIQESLIASVLERHSKVLSERDLRQQQVEITGGTDVVITERRR